MSCTPGLPFRNTSLVSLFSTREEKFGIKIAALCQVSLLLHVCVVIVASYAALDRLVDMHQHSLHPTLNPILGTVHSSSLPMDSKTSEIYKCSI